MLAEQRPHSEPVYLVNALESAWNEHDLGALADLFDEDAFVLFEPAVEQRAGAGRYEGIAAIRDLFARYVPGGSMATQEIEVAGHVVGWEFELASDRLRALGVSGIAGRARARIAGGRFQELVLALSPESAGQLRSAQGREPR